MASSTRSAEKNGADRAEGGSEQTAGAKHEMEETQSSIPKRAKTANEKQQKTIEQTMPSGDNTRDQDDDDTQEDDSRENDTQGNTAKEDDDEAQDAKVEETGSAEVDHGRDGTVPSSILEKGIIYFFFRGRVGIDEPSSVDEIARSFILLRPIGKDAKLGEGTIGDAGNSRLIAVPKKVLPLSGKDRWIAFVEKTDTSFKTLRDEFLSASDYATKTAGTRHSPAATPIGEGIYAITTTGRESHLVYMLTLPSELEEVQKDVGLRERGSFVLSTRNPGYEAPANTQLPQGPEYPKDVIEEFRALRWMPTKPKHLDYVNTQFLLIGESSGIENATKPQKEDQSNGTKAPLEELEKLEEEDAHRMGNLNGDDSAAIFADLEANAKDYPKLQTTF